MHVRRIRVAARLAFGTEGAKTWTHVVPWLRVASLTAFAWGVTTLLMLKLEAPDDATAKERHDAEATRLVFLGGFVAEHVFAGRGPDGTLTRHARMREVVEGILQRVSGNLRFGVIGFYTDSLPVVMEARDPELVRNVFNGLPLTYAMPVGQTDLGTAVNRTLEIVADFPKGSTRMIILTDGDSVPLAPINPRPASVRELLVLGVGNPHKGSFIDGHQSRQEADTLQRVATSLLGVYQRRQRQASRDRGAGRSRRAAGPAASGAHARAVGGAGDGARCVHPCVYPCCVEFFGSDWKVRSVRKEAALAR